jgi:putative ABC transport system permease protein
MIRHFFKLVWNRRRTNGLILTELTLCFLVLCGTLTMGCYYLLNWHRPLGFDYRNLWRLDLDMGLGHEISVEELAEARQTSRQLDLLLSGLPEIEAASPLDPNFPYTNSYRRIGLQADGGTVYACQSEVTPDALTALRFELLSGRWLQEADATLPRRQAVITRDLARTLFGDEDPVGRVVQPARAWRITSRADLEKEPDAIRVVGVVADYRMRSELRPAYETIFSLIDYDEGTPPDVYAIRTYPEVGAGFEQTVLENIRHVAPHWTASIVPVERIREREIRANLIPLSLFGIIAAFLLLMVGLGLTGVLWQTVTRRIEEVGIRRALGATRPAVRWQILGELLVLTTVAVIIGLLLFLQMPLLQVISWLPWSAYLLSVCLGLVVIYSFVLVCGLYPSWLATRIHPAEALQHD